jgi:DNA-binding CsgD family transcriptional regulator
VCEQTLVNWNRKFSDEIARLKAVEFGALYERLFLLKAHRIQVFGEQLARIREEVNRRDLSDISTGELLRLLVRFYTALRSEVEPQRVELSGGVEVGAAGAMKRWEEIMAEITEYEEVEAAPSAGADYREVANQPDYLQLADIADISEQGKLTAREREIMEFVADGYTDQQIADILGRSVKTIRTHRYNMMRKLDVHDVAALRDYAAKMLRTGELMNIE